MFSRFREELSFIEHQLYYLVEISTATAKENERIVKAKTLEKSVTQITT